jgi:translation elongation factor EF-Tu-like GTPase
MYSYTFNDVIYSAKTLPELQDLLEAQGFKGDVIKIFNDYALQTLEEDEQLSNQSFEENVELLEDELIPSSDEMLQDELIVDFEDDGLDKLN